MNRINNLFGIKYPIVEGGMVWCSGWRLAAAVSAAGGLGLIGSGSMDADTLREHIQKLRQHTDKPFGVNIPLIYHRSEEIVRTVIEERVPVVFTSAGNPKSWTQTFHNEGIKVAHVVSSSKFALKAQEAGVDAIVAEGFEAGGHNGVEETTTLVLIPQVRKAIEIPMLAAGGISTGAAMFAMMALGAEGVQIGTRFAMTQESSASEEFKQLCVGLKEGDTMLAMKKVSPTRMIKNDFYTEVKEAEDRGATADELRELLGRGKAKLGIFDGDVKDGLLEIGQIAAFIDDLPTAGEVVEQIITEYNALAGKSFETF